MPSEPVDAALALLEVHRVGRQVPVHHSVAPPVEIDALLADTGGREYKRPERTVESVPDLRLPSALRNLALAAVAQGKAATEGNGLAGMVGIEALVAGRAHGHRVTGHFGQ